MSNKLTKLDLQDLAKLYPEKEDYKEVIKQIEAGYPIQYLNGFVEFYGYKIIVNNQVLIPRFETELLVEKTISYANRYFKNPDILDIGTGSGCIPVALALELAKTTGCKITALDVSRKALDVACQNFKNHQLQINTEQLDILNDQPKELYDVIISNPPYIAASELVDLQTKYEPQNALYAGDEGLEFYHAILSKRLLKENGLIALEIGATQGKKVKEIAEKYYPKAQIEIQQDYNNCDRFVFIFQNLNKK